MTMTKTEAIQDLEVVRNQLFKKAGNAWFTYNRRRYWNMFLTLHIAIEALKSQP